jgi:hypothetical protein
MKKTVLTFGLISGAVSAGMMLATVPFLKSLDFHKSEIIGYSSIVAAALIVFFGVRSYRDNVGEGRLTFGRGFTVGLLITLVSAVCYVATFQCVYFLLMPGFGAQFAAYMVEQARVSGASPQQIAETTRQAQTFKQLYDNPLINAALTFLEPLPIGLVVTAISAAILRKK